MATLSTLPEQSYGVGTYPLQAAQLTAQTSALSITVSRGSLPDVDTVIGSIALQGSADGQLWVDLGSATFSGGSLVDRQGNTLTESTYTIERSFPAGYWVQGSLAVSDEAITAEIQIEAA